MTEVEERERERERGSWIDVITSVFMEEKSSRIFLPARAEMTKCHEHE